MRGFCDDLELIKSIGWAMSILRDVQAAQIIGWQF